MKTKTVKRRPAGGATRNGQERDSAPGGTAATHAKENASSLASVVVSRTVKRAKARAPRLAAKLWQLRLYVVDSTPKSLAALANLKRFCETHLKGIYRISVIDLLKRPQLAKGDQILAIPTVVRMLPRPVRTIIGNLSVSEQLLVGLDLRPTV